MSYILNCCYLAALIVLSPWFAYCAIRKQKYRDGLAAKLLGRVPKRGSRKPCVWFHAVSVGEVNVLHTLLPRLEKQLPSFEFVVSVTTKTAFELASKKYAPRQVFYCPLDFTWAVKEALRRIRPDVLILTELELWPNLIRTARQNGVKVAMVNGRLSENSFRGYNRIRWFISSVLKSVDAIAAQNEDYARRFVQLGADEQAVTVTGSLKFDGAQTERDNPDTKRLATLAGFSPDDIIFLAGSTQAPEEELALKSFLGLIDEYPRLRLILVPRHPERFEEVAKLLDCSAVRWQRRSTLELAGPNRNSRVLLVDTIGELGAWWGTTHIAFVGGSMGSRGGQNMIEPAAYGAAVAFGPNTRNFRDVVAMMLDRDAARVVSDVRELEAFVRRCLKEPDFAKKLGESARILVKEQTGASVRTCQTLFDLVNQRQFAIQQKTAA